MHRVAATTTAVFAVVFSALSWAPTADASFVFDFNSLPAAMNSVTGEDLIEDYMELIYGSEITVNLGARTRKSRIESLPTGLYLGNSDAATDRGPYTSPPGHPDPKDTFLINRWDSTSLAANVRDRIVITFEDMPIGSVEFDWEIFPVTITGANADLTVKADGLTIFFAQLLGADKPLGDLGHFAYVFDSPVYTLEFIDWNDAPIGIDNLVLTHYVPAPGSAILLATGLGLTSLRRRRRRRRSAA